MHRCHTFSAIYDLPALTTGALADLWSVLLERKEIGIGSLETCVVNPALKPVLTELLQSIQQKHIKCETKQNKKSCTHRARLVDLILNFDCGKVYGWPQYSGKL